MNSLLFTCTVVGLIFSTNSMAQSQANPIAKFKQDAPIAYMGIGGKNTTSDQQNTLRLPEGSGLIVTHIKPSGPADGQLQEGDIVTYYEDQLVVSIRQLAILVRRDAPGDTIDLKVIRDGKEQTISIKLGEGKYRPLAGQSSQSIHNQLESLCPKKLPNMSFPEQGQGVKSSQNFSIVSHKNGFEYIMTSDGTDSKLKIKNKKNGIIFEGPINTEEELGAVPQDHKETVDELKKSLLNIPKIGLFGNNPQDAFAELEARMEKQMKEFEAMKRQMLEQLHNNSPNQVGEPKLKVSPYKDKKPILDPNQL
ncbi:MAG: PDZ domain-containing protein [Lentisphaeria bacterium]|nr:PDZ domain-containing protein [Lentisphaeria bacterium]